LGIAVADGERSVVTLPKDAVLKVVSEVTGSGRFVDITWDGRELTMFAVDLLERGELVQPGRPA
jgi:hypothetical protein